MSDGIGIGGILRFKFNPKSPMSSSKKGSFRLGSVIFKDGIGMLGTFRFRFRLNPKSPRSRLKKGSFRFNPPRLKLIDGSLMLNGKAKLHRDMSTE